MRIAERLGFYHPFKVPGFVQGDRMLSQLFSANITYHRRGLRKLAPTSAFYVLRR